MFFNTNHYIKVFMDTLHKSKNAFQAIANKKKDLLTKRKSNQEFRN